MKKKIASILLISCMCMFTIFGSACSCEDLGVADIYFDYNYIDVQVGDLLDCTADGLKLFVLPTNAKDQRCVFTVEQDKDDKGNKIKVIDESKKPTLKAVKEGIATITAKSYDGLKTASVKVRIWPKNYQIENVTNISFDANQTIVWDKQYINLGAHQLDEIVYNFELNGNVVSSSALNSFSEYPSGQQNTLKIKATTTPAREYVQNSSYTTFSFYVLNSPQNLVFENKKLQWEAVDEAESYKVIVYKQNGTGEFEYYKEISNIQETSYNLELNEAGSFNVEVKAVPAGDSHVTGKYMSKASNTVSIIKYNEITSLRVADNKLIWNEVVNAKEYNVVLLNKSDGTQIKINHKASFSSGEEISYGLENLGLVGTYVARIETVAVGSEGLNSEISQASVEFTFVDNASFLGVVNNKLIWANLPTNCALEVKVGAENFGIQQNGYFELPASYVAGEYKLYSRVIGDGTNYINSSWTTDDNAYDIRKLNAPTNLSNNNYDITLEKVENALTYAFVDVCDEYGLPYADVTIKNVTTNETTTTTTIYVADKVNNALVLSQNKYKIKVKAVGAENSNCFDSNLSDESIEFIKLLPMDSYGSRTATGVSFHFNDYFNSIITSENTAIFNAIKKEDSEHHGTYYAELSLNIVRVLTNKEEEIFQKACSVNSTDLQLTDIFETSGGDLKFYLAYKGNGTNVLASDFQVMKDEQSETQDFVLYRAYEPINLCVQGKYLCWNIAGNVTDNDFILFDDNAKTTNGGLIVYNKEKADTTLTEPTLNKKGTQVTNFDLSSLISTVETPYQFYLQNLAKSSNCWGDSKTVSFSVSKLATPNIKFKDDNIEITAVNNALYYYVCNNNNGVLELLHVYTTDDIENGKITFNYKDATENFNDECAFCVIASVCPYDAINNVIQTSTTLIINSNVSDTLSVRKVKADKVTVKNHKVIIKPNNFASEAKLTVKLYLASDGSKVKEEEITTITTNGFEFDAEQYITDGGFYNISFKFTYTGSEIETIKYVEQEEFTINNIFYALNPVEVQFNSTEKKITWAQDAKAQEYKIVVKDINQGSGVVKVVSTQNSIGYNLSNITGLETLGEYVIGVISVGNGALYGEQEIEIPANIYSKTLPNDDNSNYAKLNSAPLYLTNYNDNAEYFQKVAEITNFQITIVDNEITLSWDGESGVVYDVFKNNKDTPINNDINIVVVDINNHCSFTYEFKTEDLEVSFKIKGRYSDAKSNQYDSNFSEIKRVERLQDVQNLSVNGVITFTHDKDDCEYLVQVFDITDNKSVDNNGWRYNTKSIDLSSISDITQGHAFKISVQAVTDGVKYVSSAPVEITNIFKSAQVTLTFNENGNNLFTCSSTADYVKFFASKKIANTNGEFSTPISSEVIERSAGFTFDLVDALTTAGESVSGEYKVWAVAQRSLDAKNELYGDASNNICVNILDCVFNIAMENGKLTFVPIKGQNKYRITVNNTASVDVDTSATYTFNSTTVTPTQVEGTNNYSFVVDEITYYLIKHEDKYYLSNNDAYDANDTQTEWSPTTIYTWENSSTVFDIPGIYSVSITTLGNYDTEHCEDYSCTINSVPAIKSVVKFATVTNTNIENGVISWTAPSESINTYKLIFSPVSTYSYYLSNDNIYDDSDVLTSWNGNENFVLDSTQIVLTSEGNNVYSFTYNSMVFYLVPRFNDSIERTVTNATEFNLSTITDFVHTNYTCSIVTVGSDYNFKISSEPVLVLGDIHPVSDENITISLDVANQRITWTEAQSHPYGYEIVVRQGGVIQEIIQCENANYSGAINNSIAGNYILTVRVKGNGNEILNSVESNAINVTQLATVGQLTKKQSEDQIEQNKASIEFEVFDGSTSFALFVKTPNSGAFEKQNDVYFVRVLDSVSENVKYCFEYSFINAGEYSFKVVALGNYNPTISSASSPVLTVEKLPTPEFNVSIVKSDEMMPSWSLSFDNIEGYSTSDTYFVISGVLNYTHTGAVSNLSGICNTDMINFNTNIIKVRVYVAGNNQNYICSDWGQISYPMVNAPNIEYVTGENLQFSFDSNDNVKYVRMFEAEKIDYLYAYSSGTKINITQNTEIDATEHTIQIEFLGENGKILSGFSEAYTFVKLQAPTPEIEFNIENGTTYLSWESVAGAVSYEVYQGNTLIRDDVDGCSLVIDEYITELATSTTFKVRAIGGTGYVNSEISMEVAIGEALPTPSLTIQNGTITASVNLLDLAGYDVSEVKVLFKVRNGDNVRYVLSDNQYLNLEDFDGNKTYEISAKLVDINNATASSAYSTTMSKYKLPNVESIKMKDGELYGTTVLFINDSEISKITVEVSYSTYTYTIDVDYNNSESEFSLLFTHDKKINLLDGGEVRYRIIGDENNLTSSFSAHAFFKPNENVDASISNGVLNWKEVSTATRYEIYVVHDYTSIDEGTPTFHTIHTSGVQEIIDDNFVVINIESIKITTYSVEALIETIKANTNKTINKFNDTNFALVVIAIGDGDPSNEAKVGETNYLSSTAGVISFKQLGTEQELSSVSGSLTINNALLTITKPSSTISTIVGNYDSAFNEVGTYRIKVKKLGNNVSVFDSEYSDELLVYKLPNISSAVIDEYGFLNITTEFNEKQFVTAYDNNGQAVSYMSFDAIKESIYQQVLAAFEIEEKTVAEDTITKSYTINYEDYAIYTETTGDVTTITIKFGRAVAGSKYAPASTDGIPSYKQGFLDGISTTKDGLSVDFAIVGSTTSTTQHVVFITSNTTSLNPNKLQTPSNVRVENNVLMWDTVENCNKYIVYYSKLNTTDETITINAETIERSEASLDLDNKTIFPVGSYSIWVRAMGHIMTINEETELRLATSEASTPLTFTVLNKPEEVGLDENGELEITFDSIIKTVKVKGTHENGTSFEMIVHEDEGEIVKNATSNHTRKFSFPDEGANGTSLASGKYVIEYQAIGNGGNTVGSEPITIDGDVVVLIVNNETSQTINRVQQVLNVSTYIGQLQWDIVTVGGGDNSRIYRYRIEMSNGTESEEEIVIVSDSDIPTNSSVFRVELPLSLAKMTGDVTVTVRAMGDSSHIMGIASNVLQAKKMPQVTGIKANGAGQISWSSSSVQSQPSSYRLIIDGNIEEGETYTSTFAELKECVVDVNGSAYIISEGVKDIAIKNIPSSNLNESLHYLSTVSTSVEFIKLQAPQNFRIEKGEVLWSQNVNAKSYKVVLTKQDGTTISREISAGLKNGTFTAALGEYFTEDLSQNITSLQIRAVGQFSNSKNYLNSSYATYIYSLDGGLSVNQEVKLLQRSEITAALDVDDLDIICITVPSQTYSLLGGSERGVIENYRFLIKNTTTNEIFTQDIYCDNVVSNASIVFTVHTANGDGCDIKLPDPNSSYTIQVMALAGDLSYLINSRYSNTISVTKPEAPSNVRYDSNRQCFAWNAVTVNSGEAVQYELCIVKNNDERAVTKVTTDKTYFYPASLGSYCMSIRTIVRDSLASAYVGGNAKVFNPDDKNLGENLSYDDALALFTKQYGAVGSNKDLFAGGEGTLSDPYQITSAEQFQNMKYFSGSSFYFELENDIEAKTTGANSGYACLVGSGTDALGGESRPFTMHLLGNGHKISLDSLQANNAKAVGGLFQYASGNASVQDLTLQIENQVNIQNTNEMRFGTLIGVAENVSVTNVTVRANIVLPISTSGGAQSTEMTIGGIVGTGSGIHLSLVRFMGSINLTNQVQGKLSNSLTVGGIVGYLIDVQNGSEITQCVNNANISGTYAGGIAGETNQCIDRCINTGVINGYLSTNKNICIGGLIGYWIATINDIHVDYMSITTSYSRGMVFGHFAGTNNDLAYAGGLVGYIYNSNTNTATVDIVNCFVGADVQIEKLTQANAIIKSGYIVGYINKPVNANCVYAFAVTATSAVGDGAAHLSGTYDKKDNESVVINNINSLFTALYNTFVVVNNKLAINNLPETIS